MARLSVIVPIYDVEDYLAACLGSLSAQTWRDLEVVMVDDGSPDGSAEIAARFAERDPRFRLIRQANAGLGAARNAGIRHASGEFLAFVDSDDLLPLTALETMVSTLDESGSDLVTGNVRRFTTQGARQSQMHKAIFEQPKLRTHVTKHEILLKDRLVTNKLWRRCFWDAHGLSFPEGVLYEDLVVALHGHFFAESVDMLPVPVYLWREREGENLSITQNRAYVKGFEDRIAAITDVRRFLLDSGRQEYVPAWDRMVLNSDLPNFLSAMATGDEHYRSRVLELTNKYLDDVSQETLGTVPAPRRLKWHLVRQGNVPMLLEALEWDKHAKHQAVRRGTKYFLECPVKDLPAEALRLRDELTLLERTDAVRWEEGKLIVEGRATIRHLRPTSRLHQHVSAWAVHEGTGRRLRLPVKKSLAEPLGRGGRWTWGGFSFALDPQRLLSEGAGTWFVELKVLHRGMVRTERLTCDAAALTDVGSGRPVPGVRVIPRHTDAGRLALDVEPEVLELATWGVVEGRLHLAGTVNGALPAGTRLVLARSRGSAPVECSFAVKDDSFQASLDLREVFRDERPELEPILDVATEWRFTAGHLRLFSSGTAGVIRHVFDGREIVLACAASGEVVVREQTPTALLESAAWTEDGHLTLSGCLPELEEGALSLVLASKQSPDERLLPVRVDGRTFEAELSPLAVTSLAGRLPLPSGQYGLALKRGKVDMPLEYGAIQPLGYSNDRRDLSLAADHDARAVLTVGSDLMRAERGAVNQRGLKEERYPEWREAPVREAVFFDSYTGKQFSDSPKAIYEELLRRNSDLEFLWNVRDGQVEVPDGVTPVRLNGEEYFEAMARSRYIVTNAHLPAWFRRREGQTVLQTWHGSTLKKIGFDIEKVLFARPDYHERLATEIAQWDYLVSPSPWCTPIIQNAFRFEGEMLETGYPRNDVLKHPELADDVRRRIGLPEGKKVILYAPTWRDDKFYSKGQYRLDLRLDLQRLWETLGEDHVVLVRRHPNITDRVRSVGEDFVFDVSVYPDIQELYLVSDVLITDYSSAMFDFAVTGRPILFFTYDLEHYRDTLRGFYFDFEAEAPGPLLRTTAEIVEAVLGLDEVTSKYASLYASFVAKFCPLDDGHAAARVVDRAF